ncbi:MAG: glycosyltransferase [Planctomycetes bacterium]|nr:glycosyltransferase [Planctomycetota bacterium]
MSPVDQFISVVVPLHNDAKVVRPFVMETLAVLARNYSQYELVLVDDGSKDETVPLLNELLSRHAGLRLLQLSRSFGAEVAVTAGLDSSIGDFVVVMGPDRDPPADIPRIVSVAQQGFDVVMGVPDPAPGEGWLSRKLRSLCRRAFSRFTGLDLPECSSLFLCFSRRALAAISRIKQKNRHLHLLSCSVGYSSTQMRYRSIWRKGARKDRLAQTIPHLMSTAIKNSSYPLRCVTYSAASASVLNLLYMLYIAGVNLVKGRVAEGWTTLSLQISVMFFFLFSTLVMIAEYLAHAAEESKERPLYHVLDERTSDSQILGAQCRNLLILQEPAQHEFTT